MSGQLRVEVTHISEQSMQAKSLSRWPARKTTKGNSKILYHYLLYSWCPGKPIIQS